MKKHSTLPLSLLVSLCGALACQADDDLFSKVTIEAPFVRNSDQQPHVAEDASRIAGPSALSKVLQEAPLPARPLSASTVASEVKQGTWTIPVRVIVHVDDDQLEIALLLKSFAKPTDEAGLPSKQLLELMALNRSYAPASFTYDPAKKRIELRQRISNRGVTSERLKRQMQDLATIAVENEAAWNLTVTTVTANNSTTPKQPSQSPAKTGSQLAASALTGIWAADRGKDEAIALKLAADGSFMLAIVKGETSSRSEGSFSITGTNTLELKGNDGTQLSGAVQLQGDKGFQVSLPGNATPLTFTKAEGA